MPRQKIDPEKKKDRRNICIPTPIWEFLKKESKNKNINSISQFILNLIEDYMNNNPEYIHQIIEDDILEIEKKISKFNINKEEIIIKTNELKEKNKLNSNQLQEYQKEMVNQKLCSNSLFTIEDFKWMEKNNILKEVMNDDLQKTKFNNQHKKYCLESKQQISPEDFRSKISQYQKAKKEIDKLLKEKQKKEIEKIKKLIKKKKIRS